CNRPIHTSPSNFESCKYFMRQFVSEDFFNRKIYGRNAKVSFSQKVYRKLTNGKLPKYLEERMKSDVSQREDWCTWSIGKINHKLINELDQVLSEKGSRDFNFAFVGGKNSSSAPEQRPLYVAWHNFIGD